MYPPKTATPTAVVEDQFQTTDEVILDPDLYRQVSDETACSKEADEAACSKEDFGVEAAPQEQNAMSEVRASSEPNLREVATPSSSSSWRKLFFWKGSGQAAGNSASGKDAESKELSPTGPELQRSTTAPELTVLGGAHDLADGSLLVCQHHDEMASSWRDTADTLSISLYDMPPTLRLRENRGIVKKALSDSNLPVLEDTYTAREEPSDSCPIPSYDSSDGKAAPIVTPPRRSYTEWLSFRRKDPVLPVDDALTDSSNSTFTPTVLRSDSYSYASALHSPVLSPKRGDITQSSRSTVAIPDDSGSNDGSDYAVCRPPMFTGKVDSSQAEFGTPDMESKESCEK
jgi:hypothetical protein